MIRDITIGQYYPVESVVHRLDPRTKLFGTLIGMDYHEAMILSANVIVGYTATGGFTAASTTDLVQSIVMSIALVVVLVFGVSKAGGVGAVVENAQSMSGYLSMTATYDTESG